MDTAELVRAVEEASQGTRHRYRARVVTEDERAEEKLMVTDNLEQLAERLGTALGQGAGAESMRPLFRSLVALLAQGKPVSPDQLAAAVGQPRQEVAAALHRLPGVEWDDAGDVVGLGLTLRPTPHRLEVEGRTLFTWCALDALLFPAMLGKAAHVASPCPITGAEIRVEVTPEGVERLDPTDAVVSVVVPESAGDIRRIFCRNVHFFSAPEAASEWLSQHPGAVILPVATAFQLGRLVAKYLDESP